MIDVKDLSKSFGNLHVLNGINEHIYKGEKVVIIGPSGSGKSTFLRCLNLMEKPTSGSICVEGEYITDRKANVNLIRRKMGMVFQHFNLFPHLTIKKNITLAPVKLGLMTKEEADAEAMRLLERVGLADKADAYPPQLSGGQKQRIAIVRALAMKPDVMLFDEPTSALDPESEIDGAKVKDIACTVQSASARYIPKFKAMAEKKKKISFNWAAFFFSPYWLFYRKLWQAGLIFMGLMLAVALPFTSKVEAFTTAYQAYSEAIYTSSQADVAAALEKVMSAMIPILPMLGIQIVLHIVAGFIANPLYKRSVTAKVQKLRAAFPDDRAFEAATMRRGGTSILLAFASYIGYYIIYNLLLYAVELLIK